MGFRAESQRRKGKRAYSQKVPIRLFDEENELEIQYVIFRSLNSLERELVEYEEGKSMAGLQLMLSICDEERNHDYDIRIENTPHGKRLFYDGSAYDDLMAMDQRTFEDLCLGFQAFQNCAAHDDLETQVEKKSEGIQASLRPTDAPSRLDTEAKMNTSKTEPPRNSRKTASR